MLFINVFPLASILTRFLQDLMQWPMTLSVKSYLRLIDFQGM